MIHGFRHWPTVLSVALVAAAAAVELGAPPTDLRVYHPSELVVRTRVSPEYPAAARDLASGRHRCVATIVLGRDGVPTDVPDVAGCPAVFFEPTRDALLRWRWEPLPHGVRAQTRISVTYELR